MEERDGKKGDGFYAYFLEREGKINTIRRLVFGKFSSGGKLYLTKILSIKYIYDN